MSFNKFIQIPHYSWNSGPQNHPKSISCNRETNGGYGVLNKDYEHGGPASWDVECWETMTNVHVQNGAEYQWEIGENTRLWENWNCVWINIIIAIISLNNRIIKLFQPLGVYIVFETMNQASGELQWYPSSSSAKWRWLSASLDGEPQWFLQLWAVSNWLGTRHVLCPLNMPSIANYQSQGFARLVNNNTD